MRDGPRRRRPGRIKPPAPPGIHMPGPSLRSVPRGRRHASCCSWASSSAGLSPSSGSSALLLALLYWGREGLRRLRPRRRTTTRSSRPWSPRAAARRPHAGSVVPADPRRARRSSCSPAWSSAAGSSAVGVIFTIVTLLGWLNDARKEYRQVVGADRPAISRTSRRRAGPRSCCRSSRFLVVAAVALNAGWFPPRSAAGGGEAGGSPAPSGGAGRRPPGRAASRSPPQGIKFTRQHAHGPGRQAVQDHLRQQGRGHAARRRHPRRSGAKVFDGKDFPGPAVKTYDVPAARRPAPTSSCARSIRP